MEQTSVHTSWFLSQDELFKKLTTSTSGLTSQEAEMRLKQFGANILQKKEKANIVKLFLGQFTSPLIFILIGAAILTGVLQEWIDTGVILAAVLINVGLGFYREYHAENTLATLTTYIKDRAKVMRDGKEQEIDSSLLVPGDIIILSYGTRVPADARLLSVNAIRIDEAILTGESSPVEKKIESVAESALVADRVNMAHAGSLVVEGFATAIVVATGTQTEIGKIAQVVSATTRAKTPIQKGIAKLSWFIFLITLSIIVAILFLGIYRGEPIIQMLILSAAVAVGAVPEALPIALTVILSIGAERIAAQKGIIRKLSAAETLGSTTIIMTDKTGTITQANMQLVGIYPQHQLLKKSDTESTLTRLSEDQKNILSFAAHNIDVSLENPFDNKSSWNFLGRPFEVNIAKACQQHHLPIDEIVSNKNYLRIPFSSTHKFSVSEHDGQYIVMGAPDILLKRSLVDKDTYLALDNWIQETSAEGKRLIALATIPIKQIKKITVEAFEDLDFLGIMTFVDPIRPEVPEAMKKIESQGVKVIMITGDLKGTALSVATSLGWEVGENQVLTGGDLHTMNDEELLEIIPSIKIFARVTPEDKLRVGLLYRQLGEVVAMTGDGVNDAPALKAMDIGVSLGSGSDVAKAAADLVLLDDNFLTIGQSIDEGRRILANIRKTFIYLMSNSLDEVFVVGGSLLVGIVVPLSALQIIWVNLFTGSLPAIAFAYDEDIDKERRGKNRLTSLINNEVKLITFGIGILSSLLLFLLYYVLIRMGIEVSIARSIFFVCFSSYILAVTFSFRSIHHSIFSFNIFSNKRLNLSILVAIAILVATMTIPFMRNLFGIAPLPISWLWLIVVWLVVNIFLVEFAKLLFRINYKRLSKS